MFQEEFVRLQPRRALSRVSFKAHFGSKLGDFYVFITKHYFLSRVTAKDIPTAAQGNLTLLKELAWYHQRSWYKGDESEFIAFI